MPAHPEQTRCFKNLWDYDLHYTGDTFAGVIDEIERNREDCPGFMPYEAGFTPAQHLEIQLEQKKQKLEEGDLKGLPKKKSDLRAQLAETEKFPNAQEEKKEFKHSPDFRSINKNGKEFTLTSKQAQVIQMLFEAREGKTPDLGQSYIIEQVSPDTSMKRLKDYFKRNPKAWKALIESSGKGIFRLKK